MGYVFLPVVIILILIPLAVKVSLAKARKRKNAAAEIAGMLGLTLVDDFAAGAAAPKLPQSAAISEVMKENQALERAMKSPVAPFLAALLPWHLEGEYNGAQVVIRKVERGSGKHKHPYTRYEAILKRPPGCAVSISSEGYFTRIGKSLFGLQDIETGNGELDRLVRVKSDNPNAARSWLFSSARQQALLGLFTRYPEAEVGQSWVSLEHRGFDPDLKEYREILESLAKCVHGLE